MNSIILSISENILQCRIYHSSPAIHFYSNWLWPYFEHSHLEVLLLSTFGSETGVISIDADYGPLMIVPWYRIIKNTVQTKIWQIFIGIIYFHFIF